MRAEDVALYLQNNPQFFETYADMLSDITIPHPYGGRTVSLSERQMLALREKNKVLEKKLHELLEYAKENAALQHKVHQFTLELFCTRDLMSLQEAAMRNLRTIFEVPHVSLHVWKGLPPSAEVLAFADQQTQPVCVHHAVHDTAAWFGETASHLRSFAYLPLRSPRKGDAAGDPTASPLPSRSGEQSVGLLVLASEDAQRFYPEMGTLILQRLAEIVSSALQPYL